MKLLKIIAGQFWKQQAHLFASAKTISSETGLNLIISSQHTANLSLCENKLRAPACLLALLMVRELKQL
jgi:hypothetical protein